ncbi:MAG: DUF2235 domain-containing protein [Inhella sp.]
MTAAQDVTTRKGAGSSRDQSAANLIPSADDRRPNAQTAMGPEIPRVPSARAEGLQSATCAGPSGQPGSCKLRLRVAIFFDGTGNNLEADIGTQEHSNVARLYRSYPEVSSAQGLYRFYVPGLGTYFKEIGDVGDDDGMAFGKYGEPRLQWAMQQIDDSVRKHPKETILGLDIAVFGFSRGAALARAFALRIQERCTRSGSKWLWQGGGFEARLTFMGLFDTVASVGLPASSGVHSLYIAKGWDTLDKGLADRRADASTGLAPVQPRDPDMPPVMGIAFGERPGADPTWNSADGHGSWAKNLRIPAMAIKCVHFTAGHEIRNSFPLDSAREGDRYPPSVDERVYPGVHSNVGGGYRPGEGGKSPEADRLLSLVPLLAMHDAALAAGVPLLPKRHPQCGQDFVVSPQLIEHFNLYARAAEAATARKTVEGRLLGHMRLWFAWRFKRIRADQASGRRSGAAALREQEAVFARERQSLESDVNRAHDDPQRLAAAQRLRDAERREALARRGLIDASRAGWGYQEARAKSEAAAAELARARIEFAHADEAHQRLRARLRTLPATGLLDRLNTYDRNLMLDIAALQRMRRLFPRARLRLHYTNLMDAYEAEFVHHKGLIDSLPEVETFFENYVHDSLAGFAMDATLPSDPRVVYIGGDTESRYAAIRSEAQLAAIG